MLNFISLGSGSSGNCYYLYTETDGLLIDAGVGVRSLKKFFKEYGLSISHLKNILITHDHADHIKSVGSMSHDYHLPVYTTELVHQGIDKNYCVQRKISEDMRRYLTKGQTVEVGSFVVTAFGVPHDSTDNVGYCIEAEGVTFCIITDVGEITDEIRPFISRANYLVIEANHDEEMLADGPYPQYLKTRILSGVGHLSNKNCGAAIVDNMTEKLRSVWLCHLSEENNHPELARKTVESILGSHGVIVGKDVTVEVLRRKLPTGVFHLTDAKPSV